MEKEMIEFKYHCDDNGNDGNVNDDICFHFASEGMTIYDLAERFRYFALAIGYAPEVINVVLKDEGEY